MASQTLNKYLYCYEKFSEQFVDNWPFLEQRQTLPPTDFKTSTFYELLHVQWSNQHSKPSRNRFGPSMKNSTIQFRFMFFRNQVINLLVFFCNFPKETVYSSFQETVFYSLEFYTIPYYLYIKYFCFRKENFKAWHQESPLETRLCYSSRGEHQSVQQLHINQLTSKFFISSI